MSFATVRLDHRPIDEVDPGQVQVPAGLTYLEGELLIPRNPRGLVIFPLAGAGRLERVTGRLASALRRKSFATLRVDLLTPHEIKFGEHDDALDGVSGSLHRRLVDAAEWAARQPAFAAFHGHSVGYFATGGTVHAALEAAGERPESVGALVLLDVRDDVGVKAARGVCSPTLVLSTNSTSSDPSAERARSLFREIYATRRLAASSVSDDPRSAGDAPNDAGRLAAAWFEEHLVPPGTPA